LSGTRYPSEILAKTAHLDRNFMNRRASINFTSEDVDELKRSAEWVSLFNRKAANLQIDKLLVG
jgi:hypothetical protein